MILFGAVPASACVSGLGRVPDGAVNSMAPLSREGAGCQGKGFCLALLGQCDPPQWIECRVSGNGAVFGRFRVV